MWLNSDEIFVSQWAFLMFTSTSMEAKSLVSG